MQSAVRALSRTVTVRVALLSAMVLFGTIAVLVAWNGQTSAIGTAVCLAGLAFVLAAFSRAADEDGGASIRSLTWLVSALLHWLSYAWIFSFTLPSDLRLWAVTGAAGVALLSYCGSRSLSACMLVSAFGTFLTVLFAWVNGYEQQFGPPGMDAYRAVFQSNGLEAYDYVLALLPSSTIIFGVVAAVVPFLAYAIRTVKGFGPSGWRTVVFLFGSFLYVLPMAWKDTEARAQTFARSVAAFRAEVAMQRELLAELKKGDLTSQDVEEATFQGSVIFVIGESTSRHHMSLYGYHRDTTPNLLLRREELIVQADTISPHSHTVPALKDVLITDAVSDDAAFRGAFYRSLPTKLRASGFRTWWLSAQNEYGIWDNPIALIGKQADEYRFIRGTTGTSFHVPIYDEQLLPFIKAALHDSSSRKFIFAHLMASHADYCGLIPPDKRSVLSVNNGLGKAFFGRAQDRSDSVNCYDNAIRYVDEVLESIISLLESQKEAALMVYLSDHGEDVLLGSSHNSAAHRAYHVEVPHIWYFNDAARKQLAMKWETLSKNAHAKYQSGDHSHTILDLVGASSSLYDRQRALSSPGFVPRPRTTTPRDDLEMSAIAYDDPNVQDRKDKLEWTRAVLNEFGASAGTSARGKLWAHATNSIGKLLEAKRLFAGVELDIVFDESLKEFLVYHPPATSHGLTLAKYLQAASSTPSLRLWLDWKNPRPENFTQAMEVLIALDNEYNIRERSVVETASDATFLGLRIISERGFRHAYYLPTKALLECSSAPNTAQCTELAGEVAKTARHIGASVLSFDGRARNVLVHHKGALKKFEWITWLMHSSAADPEFPDKLPPLDDYEAVLIRFPSEFHY